MTMVLVQHMKLRARSLRFCWIVFSSLLFPTSCGTFAVSICTNKCGFVHHALFSLLCSISSFFSYSIFRSALIYKCYVVFFSLLFYFVCSFLQLNVRVLWDFTQFTISWIGSSAFYSLRQFMSCFVYIDTVGDREVSMHIHFVAQVWRHLWSELSK